MHSGDEPRPNAGGNLYLSEPGIDRRVQIDVEQFAMARETA